MLLRCVLNSFLFTVGIYLTSRRLKYAHDIDTAFLQIIYKKFGISFLSQPARRKRFAFYSRPRGFYAQAMTSNLSLSHSLSSNLSQTLLWIQTNFILRVYGERACLIKPA